MSKSKAKGTSGFPLMGLRENIQPNLDRSSHHIGQIGDADFIRWAASQGWHIYKGFDGHSPVDYIADTGVGLLRVEVKRIQSVQHAHGNYYYVTVTALRKSTFDYLFVSTRHGCYWIPQENCPEQTVSIKVVGDEYERNILRPGKYDKYRVEMPT